MHGIKLTNPAYLKRIKFAGMVESHLPPCDVCKGSPGAYHIARNSNGMIPDNETGVGYLYRQRPAIKGVTDGGLSHAWCICKSDVCFNFALISDLSEWYE